MFLPENSSRALLGFGQYPASAVLGLLLLGACADAYEEGSDSERLKPELAVVNYPLQYFVERIAGALVDVRFDAPSGDDPAFWHPGAETILDYQAADLILLNGADYAKWIANATLPDSKLVDTSAGLGDRLIRVEAAVIHSHGPEGEHSHGEFAFTTWLDLGIAGEQARAIRRVLDPVLPGQSEALDSGLQSLLSDLESLDADLRSSAKRIAGRPLLASHPVFQYLAASYELDLESLHWEPDEFPAEVEWQALAALRSEHAADLMIWEAEPMPATRQRLNEMGITSVLFSPCGNRPSEGDWLTVMRENARRLGRF